MTALQLDDIRAYWRSYEIGAAIGTPLEIIRMFGSAEKYHQAVSELEQAIYAA